MEIKNKREDSYTSFLPPVISKPNMDLLISIEADPESAVTQRKKFSGLQPNEYDLILACSESQNDLTAIGILPGTYLSMATLNYLVFPLTAGGTKLSISYYKNGYWQFRTNQAWNKGLRVYGIKF